MKFVEVLAKCKDTYRTLGCRLAHLSDGDGLLLGGEVWKVIDATPEGRRKPALSQPLKRQGGTGLCVVSFFA